MKQSLFALEISVPAGNDYFIKTDDSFLVSFGCFGFLFVADGNMINLTFLQCEWDAGWLLVPILGKVAGLVLQRFGKYSSIGLTSNLLFSLIVYFLHYA